MIYEIVNPSDGYTMVVADHKVAIAAVILLGEGRYGLEGDNEQFRVPILIGSQQHVFDWLRDNDLYDLGDFITAHRREIADALDSVMVGQKDKRAALDKGFESETDPKERAKTKEFYHDQKRSSTNDIGRRAWRIAKALRKAAEEKTP